VELAAYRPNCLTSQSPTLLTEFLLISFASSYTQDLECQNHVSPLRLEKKCFVVIFPFSDSPVHLICSPNFRIDHEILRTLSLMSECPMDDIIWVWLDGVYLFVGFITAFPIDP
jgi:hypothetical protein